MDVKEAISLARDYVKEVFTEEQISAVGLEEVEFDESSDNWHVTIGFTRPWDRLHATVGPASNPHPIRSR